MKTVELSDFAKITGRSRDAIRNMQNRDGTPWDDAEFIGQGRRQYGVRHALAMVLSEFLEAQKIGARDAAEFVSAQSFAIDKFLADMRERGGEIDPRFILAAYRGVEIGDQIEWEKVLIAGSGSAEEVTDFFTGDLSRIGAQMVRNRFGQEITIRRVGGPVVAVASLQEAFRVLAKRAAHNGFSIDLDGITPGASE